MKPSTLVTLLASLVALSAAVAAGTGLFSQQEGEPFSFTTLRGQTAQVYGRGLYRYDTRFFAAGFRGQDAVALFLVNDDRRVRLCLRPASKTVGSHGLLKHFAVTEHSVLGELTGNP